jgi:type IV pilus assembly protein PilQ
MMSLKKYCVSAALLVGMVFVPLVSAQGKNSIDAISVVKQGGAIVLKVDLKEPLEGSPNGFTISNPPRVAFDFVDVDNGLGKNSQVIKEGDLTSIDIIQAGGRTRMVLNLVRGLNYTTKVDGNSLLVNLVPAQDASVAVNDGSEGVVSSSGARVGVRHGIQDISFHRGEIGEARITVDLTAPGTGIDIRRQGRDLVVDFTQVSLPDNLRRRLDVRDFATPVNTIVTEEKAGNVRMVISPNSSLWEHNAYQTENQFIVEVKPVVDDSKTLVPGIGYQGPKISINYQNGDVRTLLRLMAEELGLNAVISESVVGATTLVLKDVPADQVIDIIFQQKGLDMRKNGNVILIGQREELAMREKMVYEQLQQLEDLEPLQTETFTLNYHQVEAFKKVLADGEQRILSKRGNVVIDPRSNTMFVQDTAGRLQEFRKIVATIDIPMRQVLIEARIVEASDQFAKNLGVRLGLLHSKNYTNGGSWFGMGGNNLDTIRNSSRNNFSAIPQQVIDPVTGAVTEVTPTLPASSDYYMPRYNLDGNATFPGLNQVNLPAGSYGGVEPSLFSFLLANRQGTRLLNMEISALEADLKGRVVSSPRVMTSDQQEALIEQGVEIPYQEASSSGSTSVSFKKAVLSLRVLPHITPDGKVSMKLNINKDSRGETVPGGVAINTKKVETSVLVDNGGTVVIGGIYELTNRNDVDKVPLLGDLPLLGYAFRNSTRINEKSELLVFITPRIVNPNLTVSR